MRLSGIDQHINDEPCAKQRALLGVSSNRYSSVSRGVQSAVPIFLGSPLVPTGGRRCVYMYSVLQCTTRMCVAAHTWWHVYTAVLNLVLLFVWLQLYRRCILIVLEYKLTFGDSDAANSAPRPVGAWRSRIRSENEPKTHGYTRVLLLLTTAVVWKADLYCWPGRDNLLVYNYNFFKYTTIDSMYIWKFFVSLTTHMFSGTQPLQSICILVY